MIDFLHDIAKKKYYSILALLLVSIYYVNETSRNHEHWENQNIIQSDAGNYYVYLPAVFIYKDLKYGFTDSINTVYQKWIAPYHLEDDGSKTQKFTAGTAFMYAPFFLIAHQLSLNDPQVSADGYSVKYHQWILYGSLIYGILSLIMIRLVLGLFFRDIVSAAVILFLGLGTNLMFYSTFEGGLSHLPGLFLISSYIYFTFLWFEKGRLSHLCLLLLTLSIATVIRPTNFLFILFFLIYLVEKKDRLQFFYQKLKLYRLKLIFPIMIGLVPGLLQMALWKYNSGSYIHYSYQEETFFFSKPHMLMGLFSARNSLLLYNLPFIFAFIGLFIWRKKYPSLAIFITLFLFYYVIYSWWCWWYGGSYGSRAAIESYTLLSILMGITITFIIKHLHEGLALLAIASTMVVFGTMTQRFTDLRKVSVLHYDSMTWEAYVYLWKNHQLKADYFELWEQPDHPNALLYGEEYIDFNELNTVNRYSQGIEISQSNRDSIYIQFEFWGQFAFYGDSVVFVEIDYESTDKAQKYAVKPQLDVMLWNKGVLAIPNEQSLNDQKGRARIVYDGNRRIFYKPLKLLKDKP